MFAGVFILLLLALAAGLVLLWKGRCGTIVGNAPTCVACGSSKWYRRPRWIAARAIVASSTL